jgi:hypothetical protein
MVAEIAFAVQDDPRRIPVGLLRAKKTLLLHHDAPAPASEYKTTDTKTLHKKKKTLQDDVFAAAAYKDQTDTITITIKIKLKKKKKTDGDADDADADADAEDPDPDDDDGPQPPEEKS